MTEKINLTSILKRKISTLSEIYGADKIDIIFHFCPNQNCLFDDLDNAYKTIESEYKVFSATFWGESDEEEQEEALVRESKTISDFYIRTYKECFPDDFDGALEEMEEPYILPKDKIIFLISNGINFDSILRQYIKLLSVLTKDNKVILCTPFEYKNVGFNRLSYFDNNIELLSWIEKEENISATQNFLIDIKSVQKFGKIEIKPLEELSQKKRDRFSIPRIFNNLLNNNPKILILAALSCMELISKWTTLRELRLKFLPELTLKDEMEFADSFIFNSKNAQSFSISPVLIQHLRKLLLTLDNLSIISIIELLKFYKELHHGKRPVTLYYITLNTLHLLGLNKTSINLLTSLYNDFKKQLDSGDKKLWYNESTRIFCAGTLQEIKLMDINLSSLEIVKNLKNICNEIIQLNNEEYLQQQKAYRESYSK